MNGKQVRCKACGESWHVRGELTTPDALELDDLQAAAVEPVAQPAAPAPIGSKTMRRKAEAETADESLPEQGLKAGGDMRPRPNAALAMRELGYARRRAGRQRTIRIIWALTGLILAAAALAAILFRQDIVEARPGAAGIYDRLGMTVSPSGVDLTPVEARQVRLDGQDFLVVSGQAVNLTDDTRFAPLVQMRLLDGGGTELARWSVETGPDPLEPGERRDYRTEYPNPPVDAARLVFEMERDTPG